MKNKDFRNCIVLINEIINYFDNKKLFLFLSLITAFIMFRVQLWDWWDERIVEKYVSSISSHWSIDSVFLLLSIFGGVYTYKSKVKHSFALLFFLLLISVVILGATFIGNRYSELVVFDFFERIPYLSVVFFVLLYVGILLIKNCKANKEPQYRTEPFLIDKPIDSEANDLYGRKQFATLIADKLQSNLNIEDAGALAIGINGEWGSGKTSFANLIKRNIDENGRIIIEFNTWRSKSPDQIIDDFFDLLIFHIRPFNKELSNKIGRYVKSITSISESMISKAIEATQVLLDDSNEKNKLYADINKTLQEIKKQIIIFIDDLDRLDKKETIEILRLIRNTANFNNFVYIVTYDKEYVANAIRDFNEYSYKTFLEKIFQFEFTLPLFESNKLRVLIKEYLKKVVDKKQHQLVQISIDYYDESGVNYTNEFIKTPRDVIRLINSIVVDYKEVSNEVFFYDFYLLHLLKLKYQKVHDIILKHYEYFFILSKDEELCIPSVNRIL